MSSKKNRNKDLMTINMKSELVLTEVSKKMYLIILDLNVQAVKNVCN